MRECWLSVLQQVEHRLADSLHGLWITVVLDVVVLTVLAIDRYDQNRLACGDVDERYLAVELDTNLTPHALGNALFKVCQLENHIVLRVLSGDNRAFAILGEELGPRFIDEFDAEVIVFATMLFESLVLLPCGTLKVNLAHDGYFLLEYVDIARLDTDILARPSHDGREGEEKSKKQSLIHII